MNMLNYSLVALAAILVPAIASAEKHAYTCVSTAANTLSPVGMLVPEESFKYYVKQFTVDREDGRVMGGLLDNGGMKITLYDSGSPEMSFKVTAVTTSRVTHAMYLQINEFEPGARKPFLGIRSPNTLVITGTCE